jgi:hypothetical protein
VSKTGELAVCIPCLKGEEKGDAKVANRWRVPLILSVILARKAKRGRLTRRTIISTYLVSDAALVAVNWC